MSENDARFGIINISSFMKSLLLSCLLIAGLSSACSPGVSNSAVSARYAERDSLLTALDRTVANKAVYIGLRHGRIDSLEAEFARESDPEQEIEDRAGDIQTLFRLSERSGFGTSRRDARRWLPKLPISAPIICKSSGSIECRCCDLWDI